MYDSKTTEKPHLSTFAKALAVKKGRTSPIASQIAALVIPSSPLTHTLPLDKARFLQAYYGVLTGYERTELEAMPDSTMIFYAGDVPQREVTRKFLASPMRELDDEEGYYKLIIDDHILYRF